MNIPYADHDYEHDARDFCTQRRLEYTLKFIDPMDLCGKKVLDIGPPNYVGGEIEKRFGVILDNTECNLNWWINSPRIGYNTVLCLEVVEHLMNALVLAVEVRGNLDTGGILYLSTPVRNKYGFMFNETQHFTEYSEAAIRTLLDYAGFDILKHETFRSIPFWRGMKEGGGIFRTALRVSSQRTQLVKARKR